MGLYISVGYLAEMVDADPEGARMFEERISELNQILSGKNAETIAEPREAPSSRIRGTTDFSYSDLHYLRRAYAYVVEGREDEFPAGTVLAKETDGVVLDANSSLSSHLLCHSDSEGYYVPSKFGDPIFDRRCPGGMLGSSFALRKELDEVAHLLGIKTTDGEEGGSSRSLPESEHVRLEKVEPSAPLGRELRSWYCLWQATTLSIGQGYTIVFT